MVELDHNKNIQRIIDKIKADTNLFDNGKTVGLLREVIFGNPNNDKKLAIKQKPAIYITTKESTQKTSYGFGYSVGDNQDQLTVEYELVLLAVSKVKTEQSQKQLYDLVKNLLNLVTTDPRFTSVVTPGTDPIFTRSVINSGQWDKSTRGQLITSISFTLSATIGFTYSITIPQLGEVILLSKPNNPDGIIYSEDREQTEDNRVLTENGFFGSLFVEYESTLSLDQAFRARYGKEEDIELRESGTNRTIHIKYIDINPTAQFDQIPRTVLHMEVISS